MRLGTSSFHRQLLTGTKVKLTLCGRTLSAIFLLLTLQEAQRKVKEMILQQSQNAVDLVACLSWGTQRGGSFGPIQAMHGSGECCGAMGMDQSKPGPRILLHQCDPRGNVPISYRTGISELQEGNEERL